MTAMSTKLFLPAVLILQAFPASAQLSRSTFAGIPLWADSAVRTAGLMLSSELNPVYAVGDFDRDGLSDLVLEVKDRGSLRCGIAILHRIDRSVHIVGAGRPVGNGKDEVSCRVGWGVQPARHSRRDGTSSPDLLYLVAGWDRGGWLVWNGTTYVWVAWN